MISNVFAALGLLLCLGLAVHMLLRPRQQLWVNARLRRAMWQLRDGWQHLSSWRRRSDLKKAAAAEAEAAIERARAKADGKSDGKSDGKWDGERDGNVYRPKQFEKPRKPH